MSNVKTGEEQVVRTKKPERKEAGLGVYFSGQRACLAGRKIWLHRDGTLKPIIPAFGEVEVRGSGVQGHALPTGLQV